jgi:hypothetical protein
MVVAQPHGKAIATRSRGNAPHAAAAHARSRRNLAVTFALGQQPTHFGNLVGQQHGTVLLNQFAYGVCDL